jgi:hypothetical protein
VLSKTTDAPSVNGVEFPAVIVALPSLPKTGFSLVSFSTLASGRMF